MKKYIFIACLSLPVFFSYVSVKNWKYREVITSPTIKESSQMDGRNDARSEFIKMGAKTIISEDLMDNTRVEIYQMPKEKEEVIRTFEPVVTGVKNEFAEGFKDTSVQYYLDQNDLILVKVVYGEKDEIMSIEMTEL